MGHLAPVGGREREEAALAPHNGESFPWKFRYLTHWEYEFSAEEVLHINCSITAILLAFEFIHFPICHSSSSMLAKVGTFKVI